MRTTRALLSTLVSVVFCSGVAVAVACGSSDSNNGGSPDSGGPGEEGGAAGACVPGVAPSNAECTPATNVVCNVVGQSVTCCPPNALFLCPTNNECYPTAAAAYAACGNLPSSCISCPVATPAPDASTGDGASDDSPSSPDSNAPDSGAPDTSIPDTSVPDTSIPDSSTPDANDAATSEDANDAAVEDASDDAAD